MAALRDWSTPGRRADLIAAAWLAGETTVSTLAEAARTSRPTVYADLRSRGIDPDYRPKEMDITPITLEGFTGISDEADEANFWALLRKWAAANPEAKTSAPEGRRLMVLRDTLRRYNQLRPLLAAEETARHERDRALHQVELRWEALNTATSWLAAHHAYVVSVDNARSAVSNWLAVAQRAAADYLDFDANREAAYAAILAAGHPAIEPLDDPAGEADRLLHELDQRHAHRMTLTAQTLNLAGDAR